MQMNTTGIIFIDRGRLISRQELQMTSAALLTLRVKVNEIIQKKTFTQVSFKQQLFVSLQTFIGFFRRILYFFQLGQSPSEGFRSSLC